MLAIRVIAFGEILERPHHQQGFGFDVDRKLAHAMCHNDLTADER